MDARETPGSGAAEASEAPAEPADAPASVDMPTNADDAVPPRPEAQAGGGSSHDLLGGKSSPPAEATPTGVPAAAEPATDPRVPKVQFPSPCSMQPGPAQSRDAASRKGLLPCAGIKVRWSPSDQFEPASPRPDAPYEQYRETHKRYVAECLRLADIAAAAESPRSILKQRSSLEPRDP